MTIRLGFLCLGEAGAAIAKGLAGGIPERYQEVIEALKPRREG